MIEWEVARNEDEDWVRRNLNKKRKNVFPFLLLPPSPPPSPHTQIKNQSKKRREDREMWRNKQQVKCQLAAVIMQDELVVNPTTADRC